jgi:hypothetical protein
VSHAAVALDQLYGVTQQEGDPGDQEAQQEHVENAWTQGTVIQHAGGLLVTLKFLIYVSSYLDNKKKVPPSGRIFWNIKICIQ